jgi:hypothetical protein
MGLSGQRHATTALYLRERTPGTRWPGNILSLCRVSSGSIVSDYELDDRAVGVRYPAGAKDFSSVLCVLTGSGAHSTSCTMGTGGPFPGGKARPGLTTHPHLVPRSWMSRSYTSSPPSASMACSGAALLYIYIYIYIYIHWRHALS